MMLLLVLNIVQDASAGDGPWTLGPGENNLYTGLDYYRYSKFVGSTGTENELGGGLTAAGAKLVWTMGVSEAVEAEGLVPFESVRVNDPGIDQCTLVGRPADWCETTAGIGDLAGQIKFRLFNELYSPISVGLSLGMRSGEAYADKRGRFTTLGDGQTDVGAGLSAGRTDRMGSGWYRASMDVRYWYRFPNTELNGDKIPADELAASAEATFSFHPRFALGPAVHGFQRLGGVGFSDAPLGTPDGFAALKASQWQVGVKSAIFSVDGPVLSIAVLRTVAAINNPSDTLVLSMGLGWFMPAEG